MLAYALAVARFGATVPPSVLEPMREGRAPELPFSPVEHLFWTNPGGSVAFAAWQDEADVCGIGSRTHQAHGRLTAFTGLAWPRDRAWRMDRPWAAQFADYLRVHPPERGTDGLLGVFTAVSLDRDGRGAVASDALGIGLIYIGENRAVSVLSSRANVAASLLAAERSTPPPRDSLGACWLAYSPYLIGSRTGFEGVEVVPAGAVVQIDPARGVSVKRTAPDPWRQRPPDGDRRALVEELRADIATSIRVSLALPVRDHVADLTGGKDSRLMLGVMLGEGLADEFEFMTLGRPDLPDVVVAKSIADEFGLRHEATVIDPKAVAARETRIAALREAGYGDAPERETVMRLKVGSWLGMRTVSEPHAAAPPDDDRVRLSGLCGETLRTNYPRAARLRSMQQVPEFARGDLKFGAAGILQPDAAAHYDREVRQALLDDFTEHDVPQDAIDAFYIRTRLRRWFGTSYEAEPHNRVLPLYSPAGVRTAFAIGAKDRHAEWLHFEIIREACEPLARLPFDTGGWHERLASRDTDDAGGGGEMSVGSPTTRRQRSAPAKEGGDVASPARTVVRDMRQGIEPTDVEVMRRYLLEDRENPVFDVVDRDAVASAVDRFGELREPAKNQLYGALTAAIWLGRREVTLPWARP